MQSLTTYIKNPELMDSQVVEELWELVDRHPTYQAAWLLLVRGLFQQQDRRFGAVLRKAALIVPDRSKLFELIEGDKFRIQTEHRAPQSSLHDEPATDRTQSLIDSFLSGLPEEPRPRRQHPTDASVDYMTYLLQMEDAPADEDVPAGENLSAGENLPADGDIPDEEDALVVEFPKVDFFSEADVQETVQEEDDSEILTDKAPVALGEDSDEWPEEEDVDDKNAPSEAYFTETLARIYIKQCKYDKAIEIIRRLSLNYPKKSRYFADQIRFLGKLILNERSKNEEK